MYRFRKLNEAKDMRVLRKISNLVFSMVLVLAPMVGLTDIVHAVADTCSWTGSGPDDNFSTASNWNCTSDGVAAPENGDALVFASGPTDLSPVNDIAGLNVTDVSITGAGYTIDGDFEITGTTAITALESVTIAGSLTFSGFNINIVVSTGDTVTFSGTTVFASGGGEVNIGASTYDGTVDFVGDITGDAGSQLIAVQGATAIVRGTNNTYTATTVGSESAGTFECRHTTCFGNSANNIYTTNGNVEIYVNGVFSNDWETGSSSVGTSWLIAYEDISITGTGTVNDGIGIDQAVAGKSLQFTGSITANENISLFSTDTTSAVRMDGAVSGAGAFSIGTGRFFFGANSTYTGTNTVNSGALVIVRMPGGLGSDAGLTNVLSGATVQFELSSPNTISEPFQVAGNGLTGQEGALVLTDDDATLSGDITIASDTTFALDSATLGAMFEFSGVLSGAGDVTLTSSETTDYDTSSIQFTGSSANTFTGSVTVEGTRFYPAKANTVVSVPGALNIIATATRRAHAETSSIDTIADDSIITVTKNGSNSADLSIGSTASETVGYITGNGEVSLGAASNLTLTYDGDYTFAGDISKFANFPVVQGFDGFIQIRIFFFKAIE